MRQLFNTKLKIIIIVAVLLTAALSVMAGLTNHSIPELLVQGRHGSDQNRRAILQLYVPL